MFKESSYNTENDFKKPELELSKRRQEVIQEAGVDRVSWFKQILESRIGAVIDTGLDWAPGIGIINMMTKGAMGRSLAGKVLNGKERIIISLAATATSIFYSTIAIDRFAGTNLTKLGIATQLAGTMLSVTNSIIINKEFIKDNLNRLKSRLSSTDASLIESVNDFVDSYNGSYNNVEFKNNLINEWALENE